MSKLPEEYRAMIVSEVNSFAAASIATVARITSHDEVSEVARRVGNRAASVLGALLDPHCQICQAIAVIHAQLVVRLFYVPLAAVSGRALSLTQMKERLISEIRAAQARFIDAIENYDYKYGLGGGSDLLTEAVRDLKETFGMDTEVPHGATKH